ncbi:MAG: BREX system ATP-binding domain-containing protein [Cyanobacteriota bacterium]|nr:BREX system ATP-binding domain-containing protein [Cyanobacteriota bacterium]
MQQYPAPRKRAITLIESLRSGIPTRLSTRELPDLRAGLTQQMQEDLQTFGSQTCGRLIWGAYGQGKTHALTSIEHLALDMGFAVSRVALSREVSCHHLLNFYSRVASILRLPDKQGFGLAHPLSHKTTSQLAQSPLAQADRYSHPLPALILEDSFYAIGDDQELLFGDLAGTRLTLPELRRIHRDCRGGSLPRFPVSFKASEHASAYFGVLADAIVLAGYKGWVILIDEVELIGRLGKLGRLQAYRHLNWLLRWSSQANPYPVYTVGMAASSLRHDVWFSGHLTPTARHDRALIPALAAERLGETVAQDLIRFFDQAISSHCPSIQPLRSQDLVILLNKIVDLHSIAYDWQPQVDVLALIESVGSQPIRTHLRATLEALDMAYLYHTDLKPHAVELQEASLQEDESFFSSLAQDSSA